MKCSLSISHLSLVQHCVQWDQATGILHEPCHEGQDLKIRCLVSAVSWYCGASLESRESVISAYWCEPNWDCAKFGCSGELEPWTSLCTRCEWLEAGWVMLPYSDPFSVHTQSTHTAQICPPAFLSARKCTLFSRHNPMAFPGLPWRAMKTLLVSPKCFCHLQQGTEPETQWWSLEVRQSHRIWVGQDNLNPLKAFLQHTSKYLRVLTWREMGLD